MMISETAIIHSSSVVEDGARIGAGVTIGPFCHVGPDVNLAEGVALKSHVSVTGRTSIGSNTTVFPGAVLGGEPQNIRYKGEETDLSIGSGCTIREGVTMHTGMPDAGGRTVIGDRSMFLAYSHVAHDCQIGNDVILSNNVMLGGHVVVGDRVIIGGGAAIHQFCRIGHHAFLSGLCGCALDLIPYGMLVGSPGILTGLNVIGMQRSGISKGDIRLARQAFKQIFHGRGTIRDTVAAIRDDYGDVPVLTDIFDFLQSDTKRGFSSTVRERKT